ncbi:hypothetical protein GCM10010094_36250 [Streptomyces flaveus]|uniref:Uncharacterized protein n=1 Tax=Streptomyces flaveus TaxID=66370 RepID=A0A917VET7_9ACTN|nr:hypothetical protein GCM10010094_36250 [Streptomyces flaveus]
MTTHLEQLWRFRKHLIPSPSPSVGAAEGRRVPRGSLSLPLRGPPGGDDQGGRANRFARQSGIEIIQDSPRDYAELKASVEDQNVTWDVMTGAA